MDLPAVRAGWADARERAAAHTERLTAHDISAELAHRIALVGLARIHGLQEHLGEEPDARLLVGPDATPSSNPLRCRAGFASGTRYWWTSEEPFLPVGFRPNGCGLCLVGLPEDPDPGEIEIHIAALEAEPPRVDEVPLQLDYGRRNHFVGVFEVSGESTFDFPYVAILHGSAPELATETNGRRRALPSDEVVQEVSTAAGPIPYVAGDDALAYADQFQAAAAFASRKRTTLASALFPAGVVLNDRIHQGFVGHEEALLGSHAFDDHNSPYIFLGGFASPSFLYRPLCNPGPDGCRTRHRLLPHGAGAAYPFAENLGADVGVDSNGEIRITLTGPAQEIRVRHTADLPYSYRAGNTFAQLTDDGHCLPVAMLQPRYTFRT